MRVATLLIVLYSQAGDAVARPEGVSTRCVVGDATAHSSSPVDWNVSVRRKPRLTFPPAPPPISQGARAYPTGVRCRVRLGTVKATGGAGTSFDGVSSRGLVSVVKARSGGTTRPDGVSAKFSGLDVRAFSSARIRVEGVRSSGRVGSPVGHPTEDEAAWIEIQLGIADEEELLLLGAFDQ